MSKSVLPGSFIEPVKRANVMGEYKVTAEIEDIPVVIHYDYQPKEKATNDYPGCEESVYINAVYLQGFESQCVINLMDDVFLPGLEEICLEDREQDDER